MLTIYKYDFLVPETLKIERFNDHFFDYRYLNKELVYDDTLKQLIQDIDHSKYISNRLMESIYGEPVSYRELATGTKTAINIYQCPDICLDTIECGNNVLLKIVSLPQGNAIMSRRPENLDNLEIPVHCKAVTQSGEFICDSFKELSDKLKEY